LAYALPLLAAQRQNKWQLPAVSFLVLIYFKK
jgi:hypothetical protein